MTGRYSRPLAVASALSGTIRFTLKLSAPARSPYLPTDHGLMMSKERNTAAQAGFDCASLFSAPIGRQAAHHRQSSVLEKINYLLRLRQSIGPSGKSETPDCDDWLAVVA